MKKKRIFISVGEISGDNYGAELVKRLPEFEWIGITGPKMEKAGVKSIENIKNISVVGLTEALPKYLKIKQAFKRSVNILKEGVDLVIVIDFPGFNLKLLEEAKKLGIKTVYFIAPQVWAWGKGRIPKIAKHTDLLISIFPFEKKYYENFIDNNFRFEYVGHPLLDIVKTKESEKSFKKKLKIPKNARIFGLLAGSRESEVNVLLPILLKTVELIKKVFPDLYFVIPATENQLENVFHLIRHYKSLPVKVISKQEFEYPSYEVMEKSVFSLIASGTATLEASIIGNPFALVYKVSPLTFYIGKKLVSIEFLGLPNIIAGKQIINEFLQEDCNPINLANYSMQVLSDKNLYNKIKKDLQMVRNSLGKKGALDKTANLIKDFIS